MFFFFVFQPTIERKPSKTLLLTFFGRFPATFTNSRKKFRTACLEVGERYNDLKKKFRFHDNLGTVREEYGTACRTNDLLKSRKHAGGKKTWPACIEAQQTERQSRKNSKAEAACVPEKTTILRYCIISGTLPHSRKISLRSPDPGAPAFRPICLSACPSVFLMCSLPLLV